MKKWIFLFLAMVLVINIASMGIGCKAKEAPKPAAKEEVNLLRHRLHLPLQQHRLQLQRDLRSPQEEVRFVSWSKCWRPLSTINPLRQL